MRRWNVDKKHRCPACHTIHHGKTSGRLRSWRIFECCRCGTRFSGRPRLLRLLAPAWRVHRCESEEHR